MSRFVPIAAALCGACLSAPALAQDVVTMGHFVTTATGQSRGFDITGRAMMVRRQNGATDVYTMVLGLAPNTSYPSHVHDLPCGVNEGGGHYKIDPTVPGTVATNEIWPTLAADGNGEAFGFASVNHRARPEAQSIVVHDPIDSARLACADLLPADVPGVTSGSLSTLPAGLAMGLDVRGEAQMVRSHGTTHVTVYATGLAASTTYPAHVHALPCAVSEAGGHYKIDPTVAGTVAANEIWPTVTTDASGVGRGAATASHVARPEAQSVVIHDPVSGAKLACADLRGVDPVPFWTKGRALITAKGFERGFTALQAFGTMERTGTGRTVVRLHVSGLRPHTSYAAHVHARPCRLGGGPHYKVDPTVAATLVENEIWLDFTTDGLGRGFSRNAHFLIARPEAASIVIHDTDGERLACIDLD